jgi:hypothetical protein
MSRFTRRSEKAAQPPRGGLVGLAVGVELEAAGDALLDGDDEAVDVAPAGVVAEVDHQLGVVRRRRLGPVDPGDEHVVGVLIRGAEVDALVGVDAGAPGEVERGGRVDDPDAHVALEVVWAPEEHGGVPVAVDLADDGGAVRGPPGDGGAPGRTPLDAVPTAGVRGADDAVGHAEVGGGAALDPDTIGAVVE